MTAVTDTADGHLHRSVRRRHDRDLLRLVVDRVRNGEVWRHLAEDHVAETKRTSRHGHRGNKITTLRIAECSNLPVNIFLFTFF